ncbi:hypothetical protein KAH27_10780 [bacterium]|nr:hypothetical protein [bacterium]
MKVLDFRRIPTFEKSQFQSQFQSYLEEIDILVGDPIDPDFRHRYPDYADYFTEDPKKVPFLIFISDTDDKEPLPADKQKPIGFFFLNIMTPSEFTEDISSIFDTDTCLVASLTEFYIFPEFR